MTVLTGRFRSFVRAESVLVGCVIIGIETAIMAQLSSSNSIMYYYHPVPLFTGASLCLHGFYPDERSLSLFATLLGFVTSFNIYNTLYVNIVFASEYYQTGRMQSVTTLFVPSYRESSPGFCFLQTFLSLLLLSHSYIRCVVETILST